MRKKTGQMIPLILLFCILAGMSGCGGQPEKSMPLANETDSQAAVSPAADMEEDSRADSGNDGSSADNGNPADDESVVGQGFRPPEGSHRDSRGHIVDREGNTFDDEGGWQIPVGGWVDSEGRIHDKNGNIMGGGAAIGSKG